MYTGTLTTFFTLLHETIHKQIDILQINGLLEDEQLWRCTLILAECVRDHHTSLDGNAMKRYKMVTNVRLYTDFPSVLPSYYQIG